MFFVLNLGFLLSFLVDMVNKHPVNESLIVSHFVGGFASEFSGEFWGLGGIFNQIKMNETVKLVVVMPVNMVFWFE